MLRASALLACVLLAQAQWDPHYTKLGSYDAHVYETSMFYWPKTKKLTLLENIPCGYWGHAGQWIPEYAGHSYFRIRDFETGEVLTNISTSIGMGFASSMIDYDSGRAWVFGTGYDRCIPYPPNAPNPNVTAGVYAWWSDDLINWEYSITDANWTKYNVDVGRVYGSPEGLPPHKYVMATEDGSAWLINNNPTGNLTTGWVLLDQSKYKGGVAACPSVRFLPSDGYYYTVSGGHIVYLQRSKDLQNWEQASVNFVQPSAGDVRIPPFVGSVGNLNNDPPAWNSLANRDKWDHNSNDCDICCESWGGASEVQESWVVWGASDQGSKEWQGGPEGFAALARGNMTLEKLLQSYF